jgi:hypothetical protein
MPLGSASMRVTPEFRLFCLALRRPQQAADIAALQKEMADQPDWTSILAGARRHRVSTPLLAGLQACRSPDVPAAVVDVLHRDAREAAARSLAHAAEVARLSLLFARSGIRVLALKGVVLSMQLYGDPAQRNPRDIDLLVAPSQFAEAGLLLAASGYQRVDPVLSPRQEAAYRRWIKDAFYQHRASGIRVELHHRLADNPALFSPDFAELWEGREEIAVAGVEVATLPRRLLPLYLAVHGAAHGWIELRWLADLATALQPPGASEATIAAAEHAGLAPAVLHSVMLAHDWLDVPVGEPLRARARAHQRVAGLHRILSQYYRGAAWSEAPARGSFAGFLRYSLWLRLYGYAVKTGWRYWRYQAAREFIVPADWPTLRLPDRLFWLFPLLRPLGWLLRRWRS